MSEISPGTLRAEPVLTRQQGLQPDPNADGVPEPDEAPAVLVADPGLKATRARIRRDPAPSRLAYRFQRIWLTPLFRALLRVGIPAFSVVFFVAWWLSDQDNADTLNLKLSEMRQSIEERPEFMVSLMAIEGASEPLAEDIREILPVDMPVSSFHLDLPGLKATVEELSAVAQADVRVRAGGVLEIAVTERTPAMVWRTREGFELLDRDGHLVTELRPGDEIPRLPLIAGEGVPPFAAEALDLVAAAQPLEGRFLGLQRMGERRWDVVLNRNQRILLPEDDPIAALERVIALNSAQDLLGRDLSVVDMRQTNRPTIRMAERAVEELRRIRGLEAKAGAE